METGKEGSGGGGGGGGRLVKVGRKLSVREVLGGGNVVLLDGLVRIHVLIRGRAAPWIEEMRQKLR